VKKSRNKSN